MSSTSFRDYVDQGGTNLIRQWLDSLPKKAAAKIDSRILYLRGLPISSWPVQFVSAFGCTDMLELRVVFNGVQYRPLGFSGPGKDAFTLVFGAVERDNSLPSNACETAQNRRMTVLESPMKRSCEHAFD